MGQARAYKNTHPCLRSKKHGYIYNWVKKLPVFIQLSSIRTTTFGRGNSNNIKMILLYLPNQFLFFSIEWSDVPVTHAKIPMLGTNSNIDTVRWTGHTYWKSKCNNAPALPINCTETRAVYNSKAFCFQISFCSYPQLWSWVLDNDRKSEIPNTGGRNGFLAKSQRFKPTWQG